MQTLLVNGELYLTSSGEIVLADGEIALSGSCGREDSLFVKQNCSPIIWYC